MAKGLLIDYMYCTGCHTCEVACQQENKYAPEVLGIELRQIGPTKLDNKKWQYDFFPVPTEFCTNCNERTEKGKAPSCVMHCQAGCMYYGEMEDLIQKMDSPKKVLFSMK